MPRPARTLGASCLAAVGVVLCTAIGSSADLAHAEADSLYWANKDTNSIRAGELADIAGTVHDAVGPSGSNTQCGVAFDMAAGKIYWGNDDNPTGTIRRSNLDGSNIQTLPISPAPQAPCALVVDSATDKLYWTDVNSNTIKVADSDGTDSETLVGPAGNDHPAGLALDPTNGKIYWTNEGTPGSGDAGLNDSIRVADLNPATNDAQDLIPEGNSHTGGPLGLAIDLVDQKIYWSNCASDTIEVADLDGSDPQTIVDLPASSDCPDGIALDAAANTMYWTTYWTDTVEHAELDGDNRVVDLDGPGNGSANFPALLREPSGTAPPTVSPTGDGDQLSCSHGTWAPDLLGAYLYRSPQSFARQWRQDGDDIPGATGPTFTPTEPGNYTCRVTASNRAGSSSQTSSSEFDVPPAAVDDSRTVAEDSGATQLNPLSNDTDGGDGGPVVIASATQPANGTVALTGGTPGAHTGLTYEPDPDYCSAGGPTDDFDYTLNGGSTATVEVTITCHEDATLYWANKAGAIRFRELGPLGPLGQAADLVGGQGNNGPCGMAIDSAAGTAYWAHFEDDAIRRADLDPGTADTPENLVPEPNGSEPCGMAIDPVAGKVYWSNSTSSGAIRVANLDGSNPQTLAGGESNPTGVAIDPVAGNPAAGRIYWTNLGSGAIRVADLDPGTADVPQTVVSGQTQPLGLAIDPVAGDLAAGKVYWSNLSGEIRVADLDPGTADAPQNLAIGQAAPAGVAIDPAGDRIYWANFSDGEVRRADLDPGTADPPQTLATGEGNPNFPALLREPSGTAPPTVSPTGVGDELSCSLGTWAPDLLGAYLYRSPQSFARQWRQDGDDIPGATGPTFTPTEPGDYTCRVTASNRAGSSSQTSSSEFDVPPVAVDDSRTVAEDSGATQLNPLSNDTDGGDGGPVVIASATQPANGTVALTGGTPGAHTGLTYEPDPDYCNAGGPTDDFDYTLNGGSTATVEVTVTCLEDASLYWANRVTDTIRTAGLANGIPGGPTNLVGPNLGPGFDDPCGVAIDPEDDKIYWANLDLGTIRRANLDGTGAETLAIAPAPATPCGVAIDPAANKIYWSALGTDTIEVANLDGTGAQTLVGAAGNEQPGRGGDRPRGEQDLLDQQRIRLDDPGCEPERWLERADAGRSARCQQPDRGRDRPGGEQALLDGPRHRLGSSCEPERRLEPADPGRSCRRRPGRVGDRPRREQDLLGHLLRRHDRGRQPRRWLGSADTRSRRGRRRGTQLPRAAARADRHRRSDHSPPGVTGIGTELSCSQGDWAPDLLGAFLYRAPSSFAYEWQKDGVGPVLDSDPNFTPTEAGDYTCRVTASNRAGSNSQTSAPHSFDDTPPDAPSITATDPASPANNNDPKVIGTLAGGAPTQVKLYENADCTGTAPDATGTAAAFAGAGIPVSVAGDSTTALSARATDAAGNDSACSNTIDFTVDSTAPDTTIDTGPSGTSANNDPSFAYSSDEPGSSFECRLDGPGAATGSFADCTPSPKAYTDLADGAYTFSVRATDAAGNADASPATRSFSVDTGAPDTTIDTGPSGTSANNDPSFAYSSDEPGSSFECRLDGPGAATGSFADCTPSPKAYTDLADGAYTFSVRATDAAGNADASPATRSFSVDTGAPDTTIDTGPSGTSANNDPSFAYSSDEPGSSFECRLDGPGAATGSFADCTPSPKAYTDLADGAYTFSVRATDAAGNADASPATRSFSVDTGAPDTTIDTGPTGTSANNDPSFAYSSDEPGSSFECRLDGPGAATGSFADCTPSPKAYTDLADGAYTFSVRATDAAGNPDASPATRSFSVDTGAPDTTIDTGPTGTSANNDPSFAYSSDEPGSSFECRLDGPGAATGSFADCTPSPKAYTDLADGAYTFSVRATDAAGNADASPATRSFSVDTGAPDTTIDTGPTGTSANNDPSFAYSSDEPGSSFECRLDGPGAATGSFADCTPSPKAYTDLADGAYTFSVRATDAAGNADASPATRSFSVDTGAPDTTIDTGPSGTSANNDPSFAYSSDEPGSSFECRLDGPGAATGSFADCTPSPKAYTDLADGAYTFSVRATDAAGNADASPDTRSFSVDTGAPNTTIDTGPSGTSANNDPSFAYSSDEPGSSFECRLDGPGAATGSFADCTPSPKAYTDLADGAYTFSVRATDAAGNADASPDTRSFTSTPPSTIRRWQ